MIDEPFPITREDLKRAKTLVLGALSLGARDALHVATMERNGVTRVLSFDTDFDRVPGITRVT